MTTPTVIVPDALTVTDQLPKKLPGRLARRVQLAPVRRLTRAHLSLMDRPSITQDLLSVRDAVCGHLSEQLGLPVSITGKLSDATLHPVSQLAAHGVFALLELNGDGLGLLELDPLGAGILLQYAAGSSGNPTGVLQLTRIEEAALGWLLLGALTAAKSTAGINAHLAPRLVSLHGARADVVQHLDGRRRHLSLNLDVALGDQHFGARLLIPATWLEAVLQTLPTAPPGPLHASVAAASLQATCFLGLVSVRGDDASAFRTGDVIVFPGVGSGARLTGPARLVTRGFELRGAFGADGFTLTDAFPHPEEFIVPDLNEDPTLPVDVEIELTRLRLPLHQLGTLKPGTVIPLHISAAQTVTVRVGDRAVAKAELVEVEGDLGARLISML